MRSALLALCAAACAAAATPAALSGAPLHDTNWMLNDPDAPLGAARPTLTVSEGRASGFTGCNQWFAAVDAAANGNLRFANVGATERVCAPPAMEIERRFLNTLARTRAAEYDRDMLQLRLIGDEADTLATFDAWRPPGVRR